MSNYCIGDVHGRYDLLIMMLDKIKFDFNTDHVYLLGDVIDGGKGSIRILEYVIEHQESITLLRGNHEENFLFKKKDYDEMILSREMNASLKKVSKKYSKLFQEIEAVFLKRMTSKDKGYIAASPKIKKWLRRGDVKKRAQIFDAMFEFMQEIDFDYNKYSRVSIIFALLSKAKTKNFVTELLDLSPERYIAIITFLKSTQKSVTVNISGKCFVLCHSVAHYTGKYISDCVCLQHADTKDTYYIFGHTPIPKIYEKCGFFSDSEDVISNNRLEFDFRTVFPYIDINRNRYYNLDTASNPIAALCIDDMKQFYVGIPPQKDGRFSWRVPSDIVPANDSCHYRQVEYAFFYTEDKRRITFSKDGHNKLFFVTIEDGCYEYLIGIYKSKKQILYTRVDWLDYRYSFVIENWYNGQSIAEIRNKVHIDFMERLKSADMQAINMILHGNVVEK